MARGNSDQERASKLTDEQIAFAFTREILSNDGHIGKSDATFYNWKKTYCVFGVSEVCRLKQLEDEDRRLKKKVLPAVRRGFEFFFDENCY